MNNADNNDTMSRDLAATKYPVVIEGRVIELEEIPQTVRNHEAFTQVLVEGRATELPHCLHVQDAVRHWSLAAGCRNLIATVIRLITGR